MEREGIIRFLGSTETHNLALCYLPPKGKRAREREKAGGRAERGEERGGSEVCAKPIALPWKKEKRSEPLFFS